MARRTRNRGSAVDAWRLPQLTGLTDDGQLQPPVDDAHNVGVVQVMGFLTMTVPIRAYA